jgi:uncharacterized protein (TIGR02147 family)
MPTVAQISIFEFTSYKSYLAKVLSPSGHSRGQRSRLAEALNCQTAFVSQVMNGDVHFSLEHAVQISSFLKHTSDEQHFFVLLLQRDRAGSKALREYFENQMKEIVARRQLIRERIHARPSLNAEAQMHYYSAWYFAAIHILTSVPEFQTPDKIAAALQLPLPLVNSTLDFLLKHGLATFEKGQYRIGNARIHLPADSPMVSKHHANWRMKAMQSMEQNDPENLHYSLVISLSESDRETIRNMILKLIENTEPVLKASSEETMCFMGLDFFRVSRRQ